MFAARLLSGRDVHHQGQFGFLAASRSVSNCTPVSQKRLAGDFVLWFLGGMPKPLKVSANGLSLTDAIKRLLATPPPTSSKSAKKKAAKPIKPK